MLDEASVQGTLESVQVGKPVTRTFSTFQDEESHTWTSGIRKQPVLGPVRLGSTNLEGDGQADLVHHGGPDRAVLFYSADHYPRWRRVFEGVGSRSAPQFDPVFGAFGENLTVSGFDEDSICLGDVLEIGEVRIQTSQPRQPCWKLARRNGIPELAAVVQQRGWTGWYGRVLREGMVEAGDAVRLVERPCPEWTITAAHKARAELRVDPDVAARLADCPYLSADWIAAIRNQLSR